MIREVSRQYAQYKDSGIAWLGDVPENWAIVRLKDLGFLQNGVSKGGDYFGSGFPFISYGNVYNNTISSTKIKTFANSTLEDQRAYSCKSGDVFFTRTSETIEEIGFSATCMKTIPKSVFSGFVIRFRPTTNELVDGFSNFYFSAKILRDFFSNEIALVTRASLGQGLLNRLSVVLPSISEQKVIADYLDTKTSQIDKKIDFLTQKAAHYSKLKQALINETVIRGMDKTVSMKDSGVGWIGDIPKHWEVKRLKDIGFLFSGLTGKSGDDFTDEGKYSMPFVPFTNIANNFYLSKTELKLVVIIPNEKQNKIKKLDMFFLMSSEGYADLGKCSLLKSDMPTSTYLNSFCKGFRFTEKKVSPLYINYLLHSSVYREHLSNEGKGFTRINLKIEKINNIRLILPSIDEQKAIADYLDTKTAKIDTIVKTTNTQIEQLKELRKTLINDVVTGQIKVIQDE